MRHARAAVLAVAALLAGCGRPLFAAEVSAPSVRITSPLSHIDPGVATTALCVGATCLVGEAAYDIGAEVPFVEEPGVTVDLRLNRFSLRLTAVDPWALDGLEFVRVVLTQPATGAPTVIASYTKPYGGALPAEILVSGNSSIDLAPYLAAGRIDASLDFGFDLGVTLGRFDYQTESDFSVDVIVEYDVLL